jgi:hypothetical protein
VTPEAKEEKDEEPPSPEPPVEPNPEPPVEPSPEPPMDPTVPPSDNNNPEPKSKRSRFGFIDIGGEEEFVDEDLILTTLDLDRKYREIQEYLDVKGLTFSNSEECQDIKNEFNPSCYMAKLQRSILKSGRLDKVEESLKYCIDGMANGNVIKNPNVLQNIRDSSKSMNIKGVGGKTITINQIDYSASAGTIRIMSSTSFPDGKLTRRD